MLYSTNPSVYTVSAGQMYIERRRAGAGLVPLFSFFLRRSVPLVVRDQVARGGNVRKRPAHLFFFGRGA